MRATEPRYLSEYRAYTVSRVERADLCGGVLLRPRGLAGPRRASAWPTLGLVAGNLAILGLAGYGFGHLIGLW